MRDLALTDQLCRKSISTKRPVLRLRNRIPKTKSGISNLEFRFPLRLGFGGFVGFVRRQVSKITMRQSVKRPSKPLFINKDSDIASNDETL